MLTVSTLAAAALVTGMGSAIVVQDQASLRAAPRDGAQQQASLWQGEVLEIRGERLTTSRSGTTSASAAASSAPAMCAAWP